MKMQTLKMRAMSQNNGEQDYTEKINENYKNGRKMRFYEIGESNYKFLTY